MSLGRVVVVGQGYVGLPLAMRAVDVGYDVVGYDVSASRVAALLAAKSYVGDVGDDDLSGALATGRYAASTDPNSCADFDLAVITVPTPLREGDPDLSYIEAAADTLASYLRPGATVVLESTTYPGTTTELLAPRLEKGSGLSAGADFHLGYSAERIDPGNTTYRFENTPKVVSGIDEDSLAKIDAFYGSLVSQTVKVANVAEAELAKLVENTFRHVNIALVNELAMFAAELGIDVWAALEAAGTKPFGYMPFSPGPGVGGHCLPIDPSYLSWRVKRRLGHSFRFIELANDINDHMPDYVVHRIAEALNGRRKSVNGSRILLLGLAYKRNTGDARESPAVAIARRLGDMGAQVRAADPHVVEGPDLHGAARVEATIEEASAADLVVLVTDHDAFDLDALAAASSVFFDTRHKATGDSVEYL